MKRLLILLVRIYQRWLSPLKPPTCRFIPTCSAYTVESIERHGVLRGCYLAGRRICRCHPWGGHGFDPVPEKSSSQIARNDIPINASSQNDMTNKN